MRFGLAPGLVLSVLVAGCATSPGRQHTYRSPSHAPTGTSCDEAVGQGLAAGPGQARAIAESAARQQLADVRGYLLTTGSSRVRPTGTTVTCRPYPLAGLTQCTAVTRLCGR